MAKSTPECTTQDHALFHQSRYCTCNTEESDIQAASEGRCRCQESDRHLQGSNTIGARIRKTTSRSHPTRCRNTKTIDRNEVEMTAIQIKQLSKQAFQEARQSEDIRRDLAQNLRMSSKPLQVKDKVFYWQEDKSKIRSDGSQLQNLQYLIQQRTCSSRTSHPFLNKHIGIVYVRERSTFSRSLQKVPDLVNAAHYQVLRLGLPWTSAQDST